jgi:large conductance mechanosensitive channel
MKIIQEFKDFAVKGNAVDLAVGVVIGAAFGAIVTSLVEDLINPILGILTGGIDFADKVWVIKQATDTAEAVTMNWSNFIGVVINFIIVAFAIFLVVKQMNKLNKKEEQKEEPKGPTEKDILIEIRDQLKRN